LICALDEERNTQGRSWQTHRREGLLKSTEHNLDLEFNSLDAQREACEAYIKSQAHEGWRLIPDRYDDGGLSGASLDRQQKLLSDVRAGKITIVVVYKVDRLTRSLADFAKLVELFERNRWEITACFGARGAGLLPRVNEAVACGRRRLSCGVSASPRWRSWSFPAREC
jgi:hypothetical protein